jgi:hypothetical protein
MQSQLEKTATDQSGLYDEDFFECTRRTADLLRAGRLDRADLEHVAEEIEDIGKRDLKELDSRVQVLVAHLLKCRFQPAMRSQSWSGTIVTLRIEIEAELKQSPSLRRKLRAGLADNYARAVRRAVGDTGLPKNHFPAECPYSVEQMLDPEFLP